MLSSFNNSTRNNNIRNSFSITKFATQNLVWSKYCAFSFVARFSSLLLLVDLNIKHLMISSDRLALIQHASNLITNQLFCYRIQYKVARYLSIIICALVVELHVFSVCPITKYIPCHFRSVSDFIRFCMTTDPIKKSLNHWMKWQIVKCPLLRHIQLDCRADAGYQSLVCRYKKNRSLLFTIFTCHWLLLDRRCKYRQLTKMHAKILSSEINAENKSHDCSNDLCHTVRLCLSG